MGRGRAQHRGVLGNTSGTVPSVLGSVPRGEDVGGGFCVALGPTSVHTVSRKLSKSWGLRRSTNSPGWAPAAFSLRTANSELQHSWVWGGGYRRDTPRCVPALPKHGGHYSVTPWVGGWGSPLNNSLPL